MKEENVILSNEEGLHGRAAAAFVRCSSKFESDIKIISGDIAVNGKSIIGIMSLGAFQGEDLIIRAEGPDENIAVKELLNLVENNFEIK